MYLLSWNIIICLFLSKIGKKSVCLYNTISWYVRYTMDKSMVMGRIDQLESMFQWQDKHPKNNTCMNEIYKQ